MHPFHRAFWFFCLFNFLIPEVDKLWQTSHLNLTGLESRQVFLPGICSTCGCVCTTPNIQIRSGKQKTNGFWKFLLWSAKLPDVSNNGDFVELCRHGQLSLGTRRYGVKLKKKYIRMCCTFY